MINKKQNQKNSLSNKNVILGICASISAYKVPELIRTLRFDNANVICILTEHGSKFVTPLTLQTLSLNKVYQDMFDPYEVEVEHISLAQKADVIVIIPASADAIARLAVGRAEDLLSSVVLATKKPVLICPAMNDGMWTNPATQKNVDILKGYGYDFVEPEQGELACGTSGPGRLASIEKVLERINKILQVCFGDGGRKTV